MFKGTFDCTVNHSSYNYTVWYQELLDVYDSLEMIKLAGLANRSPDSLKELRLDWKRKHFSIIKGKIHSFKNLEKISLSNLPSEDIEVLYDFESLKELSLDSENLIELPQNIENFKELKVLRITGRFRTLPKGFPLQSPSFGFRRNRY